MHPVVFIIILFVLQIQLFADSREWTSINGNKVNAELLDIKGELVRLIAEDRRIIEIEKKQLSIDDREFVERYLSKLTALSLQAKSVSKDIHRTELNSPMANANANGIAESNSDETFRRSLVYPCLDDGTDIEEAYRALDIISVKASYTHQNSVYFEIETKGEIRMNTEESPYFLLAVNSDGKVSGSTAWVLGQEFAVSIYIPAEGEAIRCDQYGTVKIGISNVQIDGNILSLELSPLNSDQITFKAYTLIKRLSENRRAPYQVLDRSTPNSHLFVLKDESANKE